VSVAGDRDADVRAFDRVLAPGIAGLACWTTDTTEPVGSLGEALAGGGQAFLRLVEDESVTGPWLQYLHTDIAGGSWSGPRVDPETPDAFIRAGRLASLWFPDEEPGPVRARFNDLVKAAWKALHSVSTAHLVHVDGRPARSTRIGAATEQWVMDHPRQQLVAWNSYLRLR